MRLFPRSLAVACAVLLAHAAPARECAAQFFPIAAPDTLPTISAVGSASVPVAPGRAVVYAALVGRDSTGPGALAAATRLRDAATAALTRAGMRTEQLSPWGFTLAGENAPRMHPQQTPGPEARWGLRVTVDRMDRLDAVLAALVGAGVESAPFVSLEPGPAEAARRRATEQAVAQARLHAEEMARAAGGRLGELRSLSTYPDYGGQVNGMDVRFLSSGWDRGGPAPSDVSVRVGVMAVWRFLPR